MKELAGFLAQLREAYGPGAPDLEPDLDDKDLQEVDRAKLKEDDDLAAGAVMKGTVEPGQGSERPQEGDLVSARRRPSAAAPQSEVPLPPPPGLPRQNSSTPDSLRSGVPALCCAGRGRRGAGVHAQRARRARPPAALPPGQGRPHAEGPGAGGER